MAKDQRGPRNKRPPSPQPLYGGHHVKGTAPTPEQVEQAKREAEAKKKGK